MYFITAICNDSRSDYFRNTRCFGYYKLALDAIRAVNQNHGDMHEYLYDYIVIEKIDEGVHATPSVEIWFKWDEFGDDSRWIVTEKPQWSNRASNWAIG